jgi:transcription elongation factor GreA
LPGELFRNPKSAPVNGKHKINLSYYFKNIVEMAEILYVTEEGLQKMKDELEQLKSVNRPKLSQAIADARDKGDLSENAEYHAAKEEQGLLEMKISKLEDIVSRSRIIDETKIGTETVSIFSKVKIKNTKNKATAEYQIVSEVEADLKKAKIAVNSPIARALLGKKQGDIVDVKVPAGVMSFEIISISV